MPELDTGKLQLQIAQALRSLRKHRGLTEKEVAVRMGKKASAETQIARWERGETAPTSHQLWGYLIAIECSFADLDRELNPSRPSNLRLREIARELESLAREA